MVSTGIPSERAISAATPEVQPVARIVFDYQQCSRRSRYGQDRGENRLAIRRGKDLPRYRGAQHTHTDIAGMSRFMAAATTGDNGDLLALNLRGIGTKHHLVGRQPGESRIQNAQALQHFFDHVFGTIDELFHESYRF